MRLPSATREVARKSASAVERETAAKWAARAVACYRKYVATGDVRWLVRAEDMRHEALEHAATVGDYGKTAAAIQRAIERKRVGKRKRQYARRRR